MEQGVDLRIALPTITANLLLEVSSWIGKLMLPNALGGTGSVPLKQKQAEPQAIWGFSVLMNHPAKNWVRVLI